MPLSTTQIVSAWNAVVTFQAAGAWIAPSCHSMGKPGSIVAPAQRDESHDAESHCDASHDALSQLSESHDAESHVDASHWAASHCAESHCDESHPALSIDVLPLGTT